MNGNITLLIIDKLQYLINFDNVVLENLDFITFKRLSNKKLIEKFVNIFINTNNTNNTKNNDNNKSDTNFDFIKYYQDVIFKQSKFLEEEMSDIADEALSVEVDRSIFSDYISDIDQEELENDFELEILEESISIVSNYSQFKIIEYAINRNFATFNDQLAYNLDYAIFNSDDSILYFPNSVDPVIELQAFEISEEYFEKYHFCEMSRNVFTENKFPINKQLLENYALSYLSSCDCDDPQVQEYLISKEKEKSTLIKAYNEHYNKDMIDELKKKYIEITSKNKDQKSNSMILISSDPILAFNSIPIHLSETLFNVHPKKDIANYVYLRSFAIFVFSAWSQFAKSELDAAFKTIDELVSLKEVSKFDDIDYYIEFLFLIKLIHFQKIIINYFIIALTDIKEYKHLQSLENTDRIGLLQKDVFIDKGVGLGNKKYIMVNPNKLKINDGIYTYYISVHEYLQNRSKYQIVDRDINSNKRSQVGQIDKKLGNVLERNSLSNFFTFFKETVSIKRGVKEERTKENTRPVKIINNSFSLDFTGHNEDVFLSIYQLMNAFLPHGSPEKSAKNIIQLIQQSNSIQIYNHDVVINFNSVMPDSYPRLENIMNSKNVTVTSLPPRFHYNLISDLYHLASKIDEMFITPKYQLNYFGLQIKLKHGKQLFEFYNNQLGGDMKFINISGFHDLKENNEYTLLLKSGFDNEYAYIQMHFKRDYVEKYFSKINQELEELEKLMILRGMAYLIRIFESLVEYGVPEDLLKNIVQELINLT